MNLLSVCMAAFSISVGQNPRQCILCLLIYLENKTKEKKNQQPHFSFTFEASFVRSLPGWQFLSGVWTYRPLVSASTTRRVCLLRGPFERSVLHLSGLPPVTLDIGDNVSKCDSLNWSYLEFASLYRCLESFPPSLGCFPPLPAQILPYPPAKVFTSLPTCFCLHTCATPKSLRPCLLLKK